MRSTIKKGPRTLGLKKARAAASFAPYAGQMEKYTAQVQSYMEAIKAARAGLNPLARPDTPPAEPEPLITPQGPGPLPAPAGAEPEASPKITRRPGYRLIVAKGEPGWYELIEEARGYARQMEADALISLAEASRVVNSLSQVPARFKTGLRFNAQPSGAQVQEPIRVLASSLPEASVLAESQASHTPGVADQASDPVGKRPQGKTQVLAQPSGRSASLVTPFALGVVVALVSLRVLASTGRRWLRSPLRSDR